MITIGIAEDQALFRKGIVGLLNSYKNFEVIVEAENGQELLDKYEDLKLGEEDFPHITILDLRMPILDGIATTERLKKDNPNAKIIIISSHNDQDIIVHLYEKGASAFLDKNADPEEVELAINSVINTDFYINQAAKEALEDATKHEKIILAPIDELTTREIEILQMICKEQTAQEIGDILEISKRTVDNHKSKLMAKTNSKNTTGLVLFAIKANFVNISELKINLYS